MSGEHTLLVNLAIFECQDGSSWVAWRQLGASLPDSRCWPFLLLTRHSKGNAGIDELACRFCVFPRRLCPQKMQPSAGCHSLSWHTGQRGNMPSPSPCSLKPSCSNSGLHLVFTMTASLWARKACALGAVLSGYQPGEMLLYIMVGEIEKLDWSLESETKI